MNKEDNAYFNLASHLKKEKPIQNINLGIVVSISPLLISCNGIQLDRSDLLINKELLRGTKTKVKDNNSIISEFENVEDSFKVGSTVVLLTQDNQKFILICEVV